MEASRAPGGVKPLIVSSTGFSSSEKAWLQDLCSRLGAVLTPDLQPGLASHLVCRNMVTAVNMPKYNGALQWGVKVVSWQWLVDSVAAGHPLPAARFKTDPCQPFPFTPTTTRAQPPTTHAAMPNAARPHPPAGPYTTHPQQPPAQPRQRPPLQNLAPAPATTPASGATDFTFATIRQPGAAAQRSHLPQPDSLSLSPGPQHQHQSPPVNLGHQQQHQTPPLNLGQHHQTPGQQQQQHQTPLSGDIRLHGYMGQGEVTPDLQPLSRLSDPAGDQGEQHQEGGYDEEEDMDGIIPGTQMMDDSDDDAMTTPQSLDTFLQQRRAAAQQASSRAATQDRSLSCTQPYTATTTQPHQPSPALPAPPAHHNHHQQHQHQHQQALCMQGGMQGVGVSAAPSPALLTPSAVMSATSDTISIASASPCQDNDDNNSDTEDLDAMLVSPAPPSALQRPHPPAYQRDDERDDVPPGLNRLSIQCLSPVGGRSPMSPTPAADVSPDDMMMVSPMPPGGMRAAAAQLPPGGDGVDGHVRHNVPSVLYSGFGSRLGVASGSGEGVAAAAAVAVAAVAGSLGSSSGSGAATLGPAQRAGGCSNQQALAPASTLDKAGGASRVADGPRPAPTGLVVVKAEVQADEGLVGPVVPGRPVSPPLDLAHSTGGSSGSVLVTHEAPGDGPQWSSAGRVKQEPTDSGGQRSIGLMSHGPGVRRRARVLDDEEDQEDQEEEEEDGMEEPEGEEGEEEREEGMHGMGGQDQGVDDVYPGGDTDQQSDQQEAQPQVVLRPTPPGHTKAPALSLKHVFATKPAVGGGGSGAGSTSAGGGSGAGSSSVGGGSGAGSTSVGGGSDVMASRKAQQPSWQGRGGQDAAAGHAGRAGPSIKPEPSSELAGREAEQGSGVGVAPPAPARAAAIAPNRGLQQGRLTTMLVRPDGPAAAAAAAQPAASALRLLHRRLLPELFQRLEEEQAGAAGAAGQGQPGYLERDVSVTVVKALARMPRSSTAKHAHGLQSSGQAKFCEQLQLQVCGGAAGLQLVARDKARSVTLPVIRRTVDTQGQPVTGGSQQWVVAEPFTFYCHPDGQWWMEYFELLTSEEAQRRATAVGGTCTLPGDLQPGRELLRDVCCQHVRLSQVLCCVTVSRSKRLSTKPTPSLQSLLGDEPESADVSQLMQAVGALQLHQRYEFDSTTGQVVTKEPSSTAYILDH